MKYKIFVMGHLWNMLGTFDCVEMRNEYARKVRQMIGSVSI